ncbi:MAG: hypothetical protein JXR37_35325 [Kiritimatiellae bacterium]|nr:hypothetical protein [Kiritimatiellia bacterium]
MTNGARTVRTAAAAVLAAVIGTAVFGHVRAAVPDMVPMPKTYQQTGGTFELGGKPIFIEPGNRQCEIAADEIALRISELGGRPGEIGPVDSAASPGVYVLPVTSAALQPLSARAPLRVTAQDPGPQGYVIETTRDRLLIVGSDNIGALYGAMTLRQMMARDAAGRVFMAAARVYDKPDYHYRGSMGFDRGLRRLGGKTADYEEGFNLMMRFKMNLIGDYQYYLDPRQVSADRRAFYRKMNAYAKERGIYATRGQDDVRLLGELDKDRPEFKDWDCVRSTGGAKRRFCWSKDDLTRERANTLLDLTKDCGFSVFFLHPIDGGGIKDPELWSRRCDGCKKRFGDDRWKASAHQFNLWAEVMREKGLDDVIFTIPIYPYSAGHFWAEGRTDKESEPARKNAIEYYRNLHPLLDPSVVPMVWMAPPDRMARFFDAFKGRPVAIYAHSIRVCGYFGTWHRYNKTNYRGDPRDIFLRAAGNLPDDGMKWMNQLCSVEFGWNTEAPGSEVFDKIRYDVEYDHTEPKEIMDVWVPRACRAFFGPEVGNRIAPIYQAGVLPMYIENPAEGVAIANKYRRKAKPGATDPGETQGGERIATYISHTAERMARQVAATRRALDALESALPHLDTIDKYKRLTFLYYYRNMPQWHLLAKARHAQQLAAEQVEAGHTAAAEQTLRKARVELEKDRACAKRILDATKDEPNLPKIDKLRERVAQIDKILTPPRQANNQARSVK